MQRRDYTEMGGPGGTFLTTHWSLIEDVKRQKRYDNEQAKDLTQGFFHEIVLNLQLIQRADESRGRFRSFLLFALNQYLMNQKRREDAQKRIPKDKMVSLDTIESPILPQRIVESGPEDSYNYAWVSALLDQVLAEVQHKCCEQGMETHWRFFSERMVEPMLNSSTPPSLADICAKYGIESEKKASNMLVTVKRRFHAALKEYVRTTVASDTQAQAELTEIFDFFQPDTQHDL